MYRTPTFDGAQFSALGDAFRRQNLAPDSKATPVPLNETCSVQASRAKKKRNTEKRKETLRRCFFPSSLRPFSRFTDIIVMMLLG